MFLGDLLVLKLFPGDPMLDVFRDPLFKKCDRAFLIGGGRVFQRWMELFQSHGWSGSRHPKVLASSLCLAARDGLEFLQDLRRHPRAVLTSWQSGSLAVFPKAAWMLWISQ